MSMGLNAIEYKEKVNMFSYETVTAATTARWLLVGFGRKEADFSHTLPVCAKSERIPALSSKTTKLPLMMYNVIILIISYF